METDGCTGQITIAVGLATAGMDTASGGRLTGVVVLRLTGPIGHQNTLDAFETKGGLEMDFEWETGEVLTC